MMDRKRVSVSKIIINSVLILGAIVMITPMIFMITSSLKSNSIIFAQPIRIFPRLAQITAENYKYVMSSSNFFKYILNTLYVSAVTTLLAAIAASTLAYCISRFRFRGRKILYAAIISTMLVPGLAMIVPQFELAVTFKLLDKHWGVILFYAAWVSPYSTFLIKGFIDNIPIEMDEATYMDGGDIFTVYLRIILPLAAPAVAAVSIFNFLYAFEELAWSQTILRTDIIRTIPVAITQFFQAHNRTDWGYVLAMTCLSMIPVIIMYILLQKYFIKGLSAGAVKG